MNFNHSIFKKKTDAVDITVRIDVTNAESKKEPGQKESVPPASDKAHAAYNRAYDKYANVRDGLDWEFL